MSLRDLRKDLNEDRHKNIPPRWTNEECPICGNMYVAQDAYGKFCCIKDCNWKSFNKEDCRTTTIESGFCGAKIIVKEWPDYVLSAEYADQESDKICEIIDEFDKELRYRLDTISMGLKPKPIRDALGVLDVLIPVLKDRLINLHYK